MKKFAIRSLVVAVLFYGVFFVLHKFYTRQILEHSPEKLHWIMKLKGGNYDFAAVGSSRVESMLDIKTITDSTGLKGLNLGLNGTSINETCISTYHFLKENKCNVVLVHADIFQFVPNLSYSYPFHEFKYIPYMGDSITDAVLKDNVKLAKYYFWRYVPFIAYAEFNTEYNVIDVKNGFKGMPVVFDQYGARTDENKPGVADLHDKRYDTPRIELRTDTNIVDAKAVKYYNLLIDICKQNGAVPVIYTPPVYTKATANNPDSQREIKALCAKYGLRHLDMSGLELCKKGECFKDYTHLNGYGTLQYSAIMADSLSNIMKQLK